MKRLFSNIQNKFITPFGTALGTYQGVTSFSNGHDQYYSRQQNFYKEHYTGIKYQCVEYARRWLQQSKNLTFHNVPHAADVWKLHYFENLDTSLLSPVLSIANGAKSLPTIDSFLIWQRSALCPFGHIAVITEVDLVKKTIRIAEQNINNNYWPGDYSRELLMECIEGKYWIRDFEQPIGWVVIAGVSENGEKFEKTFARVAKTLPQGFSGFLDLEIESEKYFSQRNDIKVTNVEDSTASYYMFEEHFANKIKLATIELNNMCLAVTDTVIQSNEMLVKFGIPEWIWPKIRASWKDWKKKKHSLTGRFDLAANSRHLKMLEFNADTPGTLFEAAVLQEKWAKHCACDIGKSAGQDIEKHLMSAITEIFSDTVHILIDKDEEEVNTAIYLKEILKKVGIHGEIIIGLGFVGNKINGFYDKQGRKIRNVWKTWNWETLIADYEKEKEQGGLKLSDLFFSDEVTIAEPLWKVITSNKALLPVLWEHFPGHPYLLHTEWTLGKYFDGKPYVKKPIVGRCGENIEIVGGNREKIEANEGKFSDRSSIYQDAFDIEKHQGFYPVIGSWVIGSKYAGFGIREDTKMITEYNSPYAACRIFTDK